MPETTVYYGFFSSFRKSLSKAILQLWTSYSEIFREVAHKHDAGGIFQIFAPSGFKLDHGCTHYK